MAATPLFPLKSLLIGLPLGLGALAIGFAAEGRAVTIGRVW